MANWVKVGTDFIAGGVAGVADQLLQNQDDKRMVTAVAAGKKLNAFAQYGTYFNYGVPALAVVGIGMGMIKGDWATRAAVIAGQLVGRKGTHAATNRGSTTVAPRYWIRDAGNTPATRTYEPQFQKVGVI